MTAQDRATDAPQAGGLPSAFFVPDGDTFVPLPIARGPWGQTISGNYLGGILGHVLERDAGDADFRGDEASIKLKALAANNADARRDLVKELPELISKASQDSSQYKVWINSVQLAGELKIEETIPVLVSLFDPARYRDSALSTMFSRAPFANGTP